MKTFLKNQKKQELISKLFIILLDIIPSKRIIIRIYLILKFDNDAGKGFGITMEIIKKVFFLFSENQ